MAFNMFPYANNHELNLDWILNVGKETKENLDQITETANATLDEASLKADEAAASAAAAAASAEDAAGSAEDSAEEAQRIRAAADQIAINTARLDNLIVDGTPTEGNTELLDIRVGYDGKIYTTAGDAVRGQISQLTDEMVLGLDTAMSERHVLQSTWLQPWAPGGINQTTGQDQNDSSIQAIRRRTAFTQFDANNNLFIIKVAGGYQVTGREYNTRSASDFNSSPFGFVAGTYLVSLDPTHWYRFVLAKQDNSAFDGNEDLSQVVQVKSYGYKALTDPTLTEPDVPADARITGNRLHILDSVVGVTEDATPISNWTLGSIRVSDGLNQTATTRKRSLGYYHPPKGGCVMLDIADGYEVSGREYTWDATGGDTAITAAYVGANPDTFVSGKYWMQMDDTHSFRFVIQRADHGSVENDSRIDDALIIYEYPALDRVEMGTQYTQVPTMTILAAKYNTFADGTDPQIDWYLLLDPHNNNFYKSKDLKQREYLFQWDGPTNNPLAYKFAITPSGTIIAVYRTEFESVRSYGADLDSCRKNPYVWQPSEKYHYAHEVEFPAFDPVAGTGIRPSGWLENVGFTPLPDGSCIFVEYTRMGVVYTANCWRLSGALHLASGWQIVKQFYVAQNDQTDLSEDYIEHFHAATYDPYGKVLYITTGDLGKKAQIWYSTDMGLTWAQQSFVDPDTQETVTYGQKLFRLLNINWTEAYAYWSSDSSTDRGVMRCSRLPTGRLDPAGVEVLATIQASTGNPATYGTVFYPEYNMLVLMERHDQSTTNVLHFRAFDLTTNQLEPLGDILSADGTNSALGFRTEYTELEPNDGIIKCGFGSDGNYRNKMSGCGNTGDADWMNKVNNLSIRIYRKPNGSFGFKFGVYYI